MNNKSKGELTNWMVVGLRMEEEMETHSSVLAWRIPGTAEPGGLPSMGSHRLDTTKAA